MKAQRAALTPYVLKEHRAFVEEQLKVADQKEIDALKEELKEQRYLIQKVSDKIDVNQSTTRVAERKP